MIKIKEEYMGLIITKKIFTLQMNVTLDTTKDYTEKQLKSFVRFDEFKDLFETVEVKKFTNEENLTVEFDEETVEKITEEYLENKPGSELFTYKEDEPVEEEKPAPKKKGRKKKTTK